MLRHALAAGLLLLLAGCGGAEQKTEAVQPQPLGGTGKIVFSIFEGLPAFKGHDACSGLWAVNPDGSGLMRLVMPDPKNFESQYYPSFSPDGRLLAFEVFKSSGEGYKVDSEVSVLEGESGDVLSIATFTSSLFANPRVIWSPKNDSVLIMRLAGERTEIARVEIEGGDEKLLFDGKSLVAASAAWAPDGSRIAFWTHRSSGIWLMDPDGENQHKLVRGGEPAWAPDSRRLTFFEPEDVSISGEATLWLIGADGSDRTALVKGAQQVGHHSVLWSPRGDRLIFLREAQKQIQPYGESDFYLLDLKGRREKLRARSALPLAWSQDGERILFARQRQVGPDTAIGIYIGSADGTDERFIAVTDEEDINIGSYPVWQPVKTSVAPATGAMAPRKQFDFCVSRLERLRTTLSKR
jgi:Tol biopolymer transport system component